MDTGINRNTIRPRVLALLNDKKTVISGVTVTRVTGPLSYLHEQGYPCDWAPYTAVRLAALKRNSPITKYDIYIIQRAADVDGKTIAFCQALRAAGKIVVWEADDDYTNEHRKVIESDAVSVAESATAITVSTPALRKQMLKYVDRPVYLLQNLIDLAYWDSVGYRRIVPSPSIGVVGTPTHSADWKLAAPAMHRLAAERPDVHWVVGGFLPDYLKDLPNLHFLEPCPYQAYPAMVKQIDIGLAPLVPEDKFNWSKSAIKALEYWTAGAAAIVSPAVPYKRVVTEETGFFAANDEEWYQHMKFLLDNPAIRDQKAQAGRLWVEKNRSMEKHAILWWGAYEEIYKMHGGAHERIISKRQLGNRPTDSEGSSGDNVLPLQHPRRTRRRRDRNGANAARNKRVSNR